MLKKIAGLLFGLLLLTISPVAFAASANNNDTVVYQFKISGDIDNAKSGFVARAYSEALKNHADYVIIDLDTYGGYATAAVDIKNIITNSPINTICFVDSKAISAGAMIAQACDDIEMTSSANMGAAEPRTGENKASEKIVSFFASEIRAAAESNHRNGQIAAAMVDSDIAIKGIVEKGKLLTLTADEAAKLKMANGIANSLQEVYQKYGLTNAAITQIEPTFQEMASQYLASPAISGLLLTIGIAGVVLELFFTGFGIPGFIGLLALTLYFTGGFMAGYAGWLAVVLFIVGLVLLALEVFVIPGFGIAGVLGILSLLAAVIMVAPSITIGVIQLLIALAVLAVLIFISTKYGKTRKLWHRLVLQPKEDTESGFVSQPPDWQSYLGMRGVALTPLRPSGTAEINGKRVDVITEGSFIPKEQRLMVIKVDGSSVIVRALKDDE